MGTITRPLKTGGNTTYVAEVAGGNTTILAAEVDGDIDTLYTEFNGNIQAANLASDAVETAKIKDLNVTTAKLANDAVTAIKILDKVAILPSVVTGNCSTSLNIRTTEADIVTAAAITTTGGYVFIGGTLGLAADAASAAGGVEECILRVKRDSTTILTVYYNVQGGSANIFCPIPTPFFIEAPAAGTYTYKITGETTHAQVGIRSHTSNAGQLIVATFT